MIKISQPNGIQYENCAGFADIENEDLIVSDEVFDIGSVSKQFTAAAILHLVQQQDLNLNDPINKHLPQHFSKKWKKITVHHLLTHTSGIPSLYQSGGGFDDFMPKPRPISIDTLISTFKSAKLHFSPGEEYSYSNSGYILLAKIIENISGETYGDFMQKHLFDRYGLSNTQFGNPESRYAKPHHGYRRDMSRLAVQNHHSWAIGAGGIFSNVNDLQKWIQIIQSNQFLNQELRAVYFEKHKKKGDSHYAYGWDVYPHKNDKTIIQHDGVNFGYVAHVAFRPSSGESIVILTNQSHESLNNIGKSASYINDLVSRIWKILDGEDVEILPTIKTESIQSGRFYFSDNYDLSIEPTKDGSITVKSEGSYSPTQLGFFQAFEEDNNYVNRLKKVAECTQKGKYWKMASEFDGLMKFVIYSGIFSWGFGQVTEGLGEIKSAIPYEIEENKGRFRMLGEDCILDMIIYFNEEGKVQGMFEDGWNDYFNLKSVRAYPIGQGSIYIDGFPYGEKSSIINISQDKIDYHQFGRTFTGYARSL